MNKINPVGRPNKYGEKTQNITTRVPASKVAAFREHTKKWLKTYVIHKPIELKGDSLRK